MHHSGGVLALRTPVAALCSGIEPGDAWSDPDRTFAPPAHLWRGTSQLPTLSDPRRTPGTSEPYLSSDLTGVPTCWISAYWTPHPKYRGGAHDSALWDRPCHLGSGDDPESPHTQDALALSKAG